MDRTLAKTIKLLFALTLLAFCNSGLGQSAAPPPEGEAARGRGMSRGTLEIVSGHEGLDSIRYMGEVFQKLQSQGTFQAKNLPGPKSGRVVVEFVILRDGNLDYAKVVKSTMDPAVSQAQVDAVRSVAPFPALPKEFKGKSLKMRLYSEFAVEKPSSSNH